MSDLVTYRSPVPSRVDDHSARWASESRRGVEHRPVFATPDLIARAFGLFFVVGAIGALAASPMAGSERERSLCIVTLACLAFVAGVLTLRWGRFLHDRHFHLLLVLGTLLITMASVAADGGSASLAYVSLYVLVLVGAFLFFPWTHAMAHFAFAQACGAGVLVTAGVPAAAYLLQQSCIVVVAVVMRWLAQAAARAELDALTGLPNRRGFFAALGAATASAERDCTATSIVLLDLDFFVRVNERVGAHGGDRVLRRMAATWRSMLRPEDILARLDEDEFGVVLPHCAADHACVIADQLRAATAADTTCSAGVAEFRAGDLSSTVVARADLALREAKDTGRNRTSAHGAPSRADSGELLAALAAGEFEAWYQPVVNLARGNTAGHEALIRWRHPVRGLLMPGQFIEAAESSGALREMGAWMLEQACRHAAGGASPRIAVNASGGELRDPSYADKVRRVLAETGLPPGRLVIEVTESSMDGDHSTVITTLHALRAQGVMIAIDDFGTGYSSLSRLGRLPADILKIDRSFVSAITETSGPLPILDAILGMASALGLVPLAEGIEHACQADYLRSRGCVLGQGYLLGRPAPPQPADTNAVAGALLVSGPSSR